MNNCKTVDVYYKKELVGTLSTFQNRLSAFQYSANWLANGFSINTFSLPLSNKVFFSQKEPFDGLFGVFADCLPDGWAH